MKKITLLLTAAICFAFISCASLGGTLEPLDHGFYPAGQETEKSVEIIVGANLKINGIDNNEKSLYFYTDSITGWQAKKNPAQEQIFRLSPGVHVIYVSFDNGRQYTMFANNMIINLVEGNQYKITGEISGQSIVYDCINTDTLESAKLDRATLEGNSTNTMSTFIAAVLNPTMNEVGKTVIQENEDFILTTYPGLKFELTDKASGKTEKGMTTFVTDFSFKSGTVYFCITDITDTNEFLSSDYRNNSKYIFTVKACDGKTVTYTWQKPENKAGSDITFNVSVKEQFLSPDCLFFPQKT